MGKRSNDLSDKGDTRVLYKKSMSTIRTRSKTYSGHSQIFTKSGIEQIKREISQTNTFSTHGDKEKKDLAVETNVCMLRNHYIRKRMKQSHRDTSSKSKLSTLTNVKDTENSSASGDSKQNPETGDNANLKNIDVVSIIVDNFKELLNKWICENILENINENCPKLDTVRDSLLHKLERNCPKENPSRTTFVYRSKIGKEHPKCNKGKAQKKGSSTMKSKENVRFLRKFSRYTIPFQCKKIRLVSTLSIPRDFEKSSLESEETHEDNIYKMRKISHNVYLSLVKPRELLVGSSTFDLLVMSSRSLTKRCATYKIDNSQKKHMSKKVAFECRVPYGPSKTKSKFAMKNNSTGIDTPPKQGFHNVPSLVKSIYGDTNPSYVFLMSDNYTMTEYSSTPTGTNGESESSEYNTSREDKHCGTNLKSDILSEKDRSDPMITIDFISQSLEFPPLKIVTSNTPNNSLRKKTCPKSNRSTKKRVHTKFKRTKNNMFHTDNIKSKHFTYLYKKVNRVNPESNEFLNHLQSILRHLTERDGDKNMRLDVQVNVFPIVEKKVSSSQTEVNVVENQTNSKAELASNHRELDTLIESIEAEALSKKASPIVEDKEPPEIISLLDGAMSQAKYILKNDSPGNSPNDSIVNNNKNKALAKVSDCSTITTGLEISQEINELKSVIKGLAVTTEKLMSVHLQEKIFTTPKKSPVETTVLYNPNTATITSSESSQTPSESKSTSKNKSKGIQISDEFIRDNVHPDFKLKKEPKKIDKTDLNVRLMAKSTTYRFIESESILKVTDMTSLGNNATGPTDVGLTCSFPKSKSLFEVTTEKESPKLMAFYCEGIFRKPCRVKTDCCIKTDCCSSVVSSCRPCDPCCASTAKTVNRPPSIRTIELRCPKSCGGYGDDEDPEERNLIEDEICDDCPKCRRSVGFYEGFLYCMVIWVPVIIILILFYLSVIKKNLPKKVTAPSSGTNNTMQYLKLSDLGF